MNAIGGKRKIFWLFAIVLTAFTGLFNPRPVYPAPPVAELKSPAAGRLLSPAEQASAKALQAQALAMAAVRRALKAAESARSASADTATRTRRYNETADNQGHRYRGGWRKSPRNPLGYQGFGVLSWPNANRYEGEFLNGRKHGYGVFTGGNGDGYAGAFLNGEITGYGRYGYANGNRYEGDFSHDLRQGYGVMIYANGERYQGEWRDNEKSGFGVLYAPDGSIHYSGFW